MLLGNYDLLFNVHPFMTGADFVDQKITLPLRWALIVATLGAIPLVWTSRYVKALYLIGAFFVLQIVVPLDRRAPCMSAPTKFRSSGRIFSVT